MPFHVNILCPLNNKVLQRREEANPHHAQRQAHLLTMILTSTTTAPSPCG
jgi:hypothetical protein